MPLLTPTPLPSMPSLELDIAQMRVTTDAPRDSRTPAVRAGRCGRKEYPHTHTSAGGDHNAGQPERNLNDRVGLEMHRPELQGGDDARNQLLRKAPGSCLND